jgi:hypothetical protein
VATTVGDWTKRIQERFGDRSVTLRGTTSVHGYSRPMYMIIEIPHADQGPTFATLGEAQAALRAMAHAHPETSDAFGIVGLDREGSPTGEVIPLPREAGFTV